MAEHSFDAIGTSWLIRTPQPLTGRVSGHLLDRAGEFDRAYSRFRADSQVTAFSAAAGEHRFPDDLPPLMTFYRTLYEVTGGAVTPLVGTALEHLGYGADYRLRRNPGMAAVPGWDDVLRVDGSLLTSTEPVLLDLGAAGKGHLADLLSQILLDAGHDEHLVDGSGDLVHRGPRPCRVGLEDPADPSRVIGVANLGGQGPGPSALCASATNRRRWGDGLHHILDPFTGEPTTSVDATWVVADSAMVADGLATALFLTDPAVLATRFDFRFVRLLASGGIEHSTDFDGELFT